MNMLHAKTSVLNLQKAIMILNFSIVRLKKIGLYMSSKEIKGFTLKKKYHSNLGGKKITDKGSYKKYVIRQMTLFDFPSFPFHSPPSVLFNKKL